MKKILAILLVALMLVGMIPMAAISAAAADEVSVKITFDANKTNRTSFSANSQVWQKDGLTFTNDKASSSSAVADYSNPVRLYQGSKVTIEHTGMTKIVITSDGTAKYKTALENSLKGAGYSYTNSGNAYTITLSPAADSVTFSLTAQARFKDITVTASVSSGDDACTHPNAEQKDAVAATCLTAGYEAGVYCPDCRIYTEGGSVIAALGHAYSDWTDVTVATCTEAGQQKAICANCQDEKTQTVAALGHIYVDGTCTGCGHVAVMTNYELVTDATSLKAGDQIVLVGIDKNGAYSVMMAYTSGNNLKPESISAPAEGKIELADTSAAAILTLGGDADGWTLFDGAKYLYAPGKASDNYLKATAELPEDNTGAWTITIDENGLATITNVGNTGDGARNTIFFNYGNMLFAAYKADYSQNASKVSIYRLSDGTTEEPEGCAHENTTTTTVDATCTEAGSTTVVCDDCGETISTEEIEALGHSYVDNICVNCGAEFEGEIDTPDPSEPEAEAGYVLADSILIGDKIIIVSQDAKMELTSISTTSTKYGVGTAYTDAPAAIWVFTVAEGANDGTYALVDDNGNYLNWASGSKNTLTTVTSLSANSSWSISIDENGYAHIKNTADSARQIWWNVQSPRFACYTGKTLETTGYYCPNIYKYTTGKECEHVWGEWVVTQAPTCTEAGVQVSTCSQCKAEQTGTVPATGHNYTYVDGAMTCTCGDSVAINTIAEAKAYTSTTQVYYLKGIVTYVNADKVYIEDNTGAILVFFDKTVDTSKIALGDELVVWDTMTKYNGLIETTYTLSTEYMIVSSGNELPSQTVTIADLLADTTNEYLAERVVIENVTIGVLGTNNTALTDASGNTINIYKAPALDEKINANDTVTVTAIVSSYNAYQLLVNSAADVVETAAGEEEVIETVTIATAKAGAEGDYFQVEGVVTYIAGRNVYIQDETGAIVVYLTANAATVKVGDKVKAYGALKSYYGLLELDAVDETNVKFFEILSNDNTVDAQALTIEALNADLTNEYLAEKITLENVYISYFSYNSTRNDVTYTLIDANGNTIKINRVAVTAESDCYAAGSLVNLEAYVSKYVNDSTEGNGYQLVTDNAKITVLSVCNHETTELVNFVQASCGVAGYTGDVQCTVCKYYVSRGEDVAAREHDFQGVVTDPTCTERGYTTYACIHCGEVDEVTDYVDALGHSYVDGVCGICGAADPDYVACEHNYIAEITYATTSAGGYTTYTCEHCGDSYQDNFTNKLPMNLRFASAYLALESDLSVIFQVKSEVLAAYEDVRLVFTLGDGERVMEMTEEEYFLGQYSRPSFKFTGVAPRHANTTIYATLYGTIEGVEHTYTMQYSATKYCYSTLRSAATTAPLKTLIVDLLNYGAAHQVYGNTNVENLATYDLTDAEKALGTSAIPAMTSYMSVKYVAHAAPTARFNNAALYLEDAVTIRCKLTLNEGVDVNNVTVKVTDDEGNEWIVLGEELTHDSGNVYYLNFNALSAQQMRKIVYITICENGEAISHTLRYSIESYAANSYNGSGTALDNVVLAMMRYGDSAKAYFESK